MSDIKPRIDHLPREEWTDDAREVFAFWGEPNAWEEGSKTNVMMTLANHPDLAKPYNLWSKHLLMSNTLGVRVLEILILRVAVRVKSEYEWHNHVGYGLNAGLTLEEIAAIRDYPNDWDWAEADAIILKAVDELIDAGNWSDATWETLGKYFDTKQKMDLVFSIGHYVMTSWALSAMGVPIEGGADKIGFDLKTQSGKTPGKTYKPGETEDWTDSRGY
ncbi:carboxymuconolactone decarboxylase family protein [Stakelama tenebrarum]|uniref:Carboxymuconolactone decarboxylase family protein n=1 Tax=Stakelama tenebrarum TaxID=2711215 RepID=A0A6G6Y7D2_9SPHN|nr:carboxymuconolactone decarboxylase family protein [Sphingosinithalassobacter tenebrarum]QIG80819.1 carboxymuconolactone decarboxylase family protein [Sphingosinithalassobacter tenebrarum]